MAYKIPLFDLNFDRKEEKAVLRTLRSRWISTGPANKKLEEKFSSMIGARFAAALSNCTVGLHLALKALGVGDGDEVICPSLTFVATANAIRYVNAVPVFCDITGLNDLTINADLIEQLITPKTKAIMVMHYAGFPCNMDRIMALSQKYKLKVVEDTSHGPLSEYKGTKLGTIGDIGCFSFFSNKNISTGEGGMLVTNNKEYYERAKLLRSHGMTSLSYERAKGHSTSYDVLELGYNYRMDDIRASLGLVQLGKLKSDIKIRASLRKRYIKNLGRIEGIVIPFKNNVNFVSNYILPVVLKDSDYLIREKVREKLYNSGIQTSVHYPAVHRFSIYKDYKTNLPLTEYVADNEITLPLYSKLSINLIDYICKKLKEAINR